MNIPWEPKTAAERRAFIDRVHDELMAERVKDGGENVHLLDDMRFRQEAARRGYPIKTRRPGPKRQIDPNAPLEQAKHDARRLGLIFMRLWGHRNRHADPSVVAILAEIWGLSEPDQEKLQAHLSKKKG